VDDTFIQLVGVPHPSPAKAKEFVAIDQKSGMEAILAAKRAGVGHFIYVLGPGHRWPYALIPFYWLAERIPRTREGARRLGLVTVEQMLKALARAVDRPPAGVAVMDVSAIRAAQ
jgi:hypothetical protein